MVQTMLAEAVCPSHLPGYGRTSKQPFESHHGLLSPGCFFPDLYQALPQELNVMEGRQSSLPARLSVAGDPLATASCPDFSGASVCKMSCNSCGGTEPGFLGLLWLEAAVSRGLFGTAEAPSTSGF